MTAAAEPSIGATPARWSDGNFWTRVSGAAPVAYAQLASDQEADVAVVGAGIVGLTAAQALAAAGKSVVVLEARRIGEQATGRSTAKVSSQHGLIYSRLIRDFGEKQAGIYAQCNEAAIAHIASLVERTGMDCGFERKPAYIYGQSDAAAKIEEEARAASRLGLPAQVVRETPLPFEVAVALRFDNQAQFNPVLYLRGLAAEVARHAGVHEGCRVVKISKEGGRQIVCTEAGPVLRVRDVVVATQMPIVSDGLFYTRAYPISHPMLAGRIDPARAPDGMYISTSSPSHSFRVHGSGSELYMVAVGGTYKTGETEDEQRLLLELEQFVGREFGVDQPEYRWINEDFQPMDGLPFVGRASGSDQHVYVATGFNAWGITNGTSAALLIADQILGRENPAAKLFDATRIKPVVGGKDFLKENLHAAQHFVGDRLRTPRSELPVPEQGAGMVVKVHGEPLACYHDETGTVHRVSAVCTHMGCLVAWNATDRSWDCPCHGSRFSCDGQVLCGPATTPLAKAPT